MYLVFTASKDTYITNKILAPTLRATDANLGGATTIDLFKLYGETLFTGVTNPIELSRGLIYFELADISSSLAGKVDFSHSTFKATLKLHDVQGNQVAPAGFNLAVFPLSKSFDEGKGKDVSGLSYLDRTNWLTASYGTDNVVWNSPGAFASGALGASNIDVIESGSIGGTDTYLVKSQYFRTADQDLSIDVTNIVSASMVGILPSHGFLLAYSGSEEFDTTTRFVKRFSSRHTRNPYIRPKLIVSYDNSIRAQNKQLEFNVTGSVFLENFSRGTRSNILSGSSNTQITGSNSLLFKIHTGSYEKYFTGSQASVAGIDQTGIYSVSFAVDRFLSASVTSTATLEDFVIASGSITFGQEWLSLDESLSYFTGSLTIDSQVRASGTNQSKYRFSLTNLRSEYQITDLPRIEIFVTDLAAERASVRIPIQLTTVFLSTVYYQIRDAYNGQILTPFTEALNATRVSNDSLGLYFEPSFAHLPRGRSYTIDLMTVDNGIKRKYMDNGIFRIA